MSDVDKFSAFIKNLQDKIQHDYFQAIRNLEAEKEERIRKETIDSLIEELEKL